MAAVERVLELARSEAGYLEKASRAELDSKSANAGRGNYTKYARDLDDTDIFNGKKQGQPWCCVFALWPFVKAFGAERARAMMNIPKRSLAAGVKYLAGYFKSAGRFFTEGPEPGDLVFFYNAQRTGWAHAGLVESVADDAGILFTVEGNTSGTSGVVANGGCVAQKSYPLDYERIAGFGRPDWSLAAEEKPSAWAAESAERAVAAGAILGDGAGNYRWRDAVTREELAVILDRLGLFRNSNGE